MLNHIARQWIIICSGHPLSSFSKGTYLNGRVNLSKRKRLAKCSMCEHSGPEWEYVKIFYSPNINFHFIHSFLLSACNNVNRELIKPIYLKASKHSGCRRWTRKYIQMILKQTCLSNNQDNSSKIAFLFGSIFFP